uniref:Angiotensin II receptor associated protein n=1 Tax=Pelodiscus sinensis TaxID=13735 RepID=K7FRQ7_PELSI
MCNILRLWLLLVWAVWLLWVNQMSNQCPHVSDFQFLIGLLLTILTDIIHLSIYYPRGHNLTDLQRFTAGMAIFSLLLKPLSCFFVYQMYRERGGEYAFNLGFPTVSRDRSAYQSIDQQDVPCPYPDLDSKPAPRPF